MESCYRCGNELQLQSKIKATEIRGIPIKYEKEFLKCMQCDEAYTNKDIAQKNLDVLSKSYLEKIDLDMNIFKEVRTWLNLNLDEMVKNLEDNHKVKVSKEALEKVEEVKFLPSDSIINVYKYLKSVKMEKATRN